MIVRKAVTYGSKSGILAVSESLTTKKEMYVGMLEAYNRSLKKIPSLKQSEFEMAVFREQIEGLNEEDPNNARNYKGISQLLFQIRGFRIFSVESLNYLQNWAIKDWTTLSDIEKSKIMIFFAQNRRCFFYDQNNIPSSIESEKDMGIIYSACICNESLIFTKPLQIKDKVLKNSEWASQLKFLKLIGAEKNQQSMEKYHRRSPLEIQIESLLKAMDEDIRRQVSINNIRIDFMINKKVGLEVLGPHHFTVEQKVKGRDIMRKLILQQWLQIKEITHFEMNRVKGMQNKLRLLKEVIDS